MLFNKLNIKGFKAIIIISVSVIVCNCVPVKKQLLVRDHKKKNLKEIRKTDTTLLYQPFEYRLKSGDLLSINLISLAKGEYDLSSLSQQGNIAPKNGGGGTAQTGYAVNDSGYVSFPVLGTIKVGGLSLKETEKLVQQKVNGILDNTTANIRMLNYYVYLIGEVNAQGQIFAPTDRITLLEAIAFAGGLTDYTDRAHIKIVRNYDNRAHIYYVDLSNQDLLTMKQIYLLPNDIVMFEPLRAKVVKAYTIPNISLLISAVTLVLTLSFTFSNLLNR